LTAVRQTIVFQRWLEDLRSHTAQAVILRRLKRFAQGNPGETKSVGGGILELRIHFGPGYRVYYKRTGDTLVILLCGGDKGSQEADILRAKRLAAQEGDTYDFEVD
jgi:putative addiction module killer protein